jgi:hypothetical protein
MDQTTEAAEPAAADKKYLTVRQAAFIGVGAKVGAGIFALLGVAPGLRMETLPRHQDEVRPARALSQEPR